MKICCKCQTKKPFDEFRKGRSKCKQCAYAEKRAWYQRHHDKVKADARQYYHKTKDLRLVQMREWRNSHQQYRKEKRREWHQANKPDQNIKTRQYYATHKKQIYEKHKEWRLADPTLSRWHASVRHQRLKGTPNDLTREQWLARLEEFGHHCAYCWAEGVPLTQDHLIPIVKGGAHTIDNVVPACKPCNAKKQARSMLEVLKLIS